jgi:hypothetical protein
MTLGLAIAGFISPFRPNEIARGKVAETENACRAEDHHWFMHDYKRVIHTSTMERLHY